MNGAVALRGWSAGLPGDGAWMGWVARNGRGLHLAQELDEARETLLPCGFVAWNRVAGIFAGAHESVPRAIVCDRIVYLARGLHGIDGSGNRGSNARIVASIEAIYRSGDGGNILGARPVEDEGGRKIFAMGCESERLAPTPTEASHCDFAVGGGKVLAVVGCGVEVGRDNVLVKAGDGFDGRILAWKLAGAAAIGTKSGEQVGSDDNESLAGQFVGHFLGPIAEAEYLVNENDNRGLGFDLRVNDRPAPCGCRA